MAREFDPDRLDSETRALWDQHFAGPLPENEGEAIQVWGFGYWSMIELGRIPTEVAEYLAEVDPDNSIRQYLENARRALWKRDESG